MPGLSIRRDNFMSQKSLFQNIKACVFDAYGTLFDFNSAVGKYRDRFGDKADQVSALWRTKQLEYTWLRSLMRQHKDFWQVTQDALDYALDACGIAHRDLRNDLIDAYLHLEPYSDVPETLRTLKSHGLRPAILSNGSPAMLEAAVKSSKLEDVIEAALSVEQVGVYKPDPRVYRLAEDSLKLRGEEIVFLSANAWDAVGAANAGLRVVWINRFGQRRERLPSQPDAVIKTLLDLPELLGY
jgi:2-haloacid dehalogenase